MTVGPSGQQQKTLGEVTELVACAELNLENLARAVPGLAVHPFYKIVKYQLRCAQVIFGEDPTIEESQETHL